MVYIAITMFMALLGLLSVQYYWTKRIVQLNREFITTSIDAAMQEVVRQMDRGALFEHLSRVKIRKKVRLEVDSLNACIREMRSKYPAVLGKPSGFCWRSDGSYALTSTGVQQVEWRDTVGGVTISSSYIQSDYGLWGGGRDLPERQREEIRQAYLRLQQERDDLLYAISMMDDLLAPSLREPAQMEMELRGLAPVVDSLVENAVSRHHFRAGLEWGIYSTYSSKLILQKSGNYGVQLLQSPFNYQLYPQHDMPYPFFLVAYLPGRVSFVLSQMWYLVVSSFLLLVLLLYTFTYTLVSIWRQKKLTEMKSDFINHVTHEIKTPVSTISLICESFNDPDVHYDKESLANVMRIIRHENQRLESLSRQIIQISKMEKGDYFLDKTRFSLHKAIEEAVNNTGFQVMHRNGRIVTRLEAENDEIEGDRTHIVHIISNLIDNANKYCTERPLIEISTENEGRGIRVDVKDNGIGISKSNIDKIFDKLYRVPTGNKHDVKGFGLGLSYVRSIMQQHGGRVWVESEPKQGSVFHLLFPQKDA